MAIAETIRENLKKFLDSKKLNYYEDSSDDEILVLFAGKGKRPGLKFTFNVREWHKDTSLLHIRGVLQGGELTEEQIALLLYTCNEHNTSSFFPQCSILMKESDGKPTTGKLATDLVVLLTDDASYESVEVHADAMLATSFGFFDSLFSDKEEENG